MRKATAQSPGESISSSLPTLRVECSKLPPTKHTCACIFTHPTHHEERLEESIYVLRLRLSSLSAVTASEGALWDCVHTFILRYSQLKVWEFYLCGEILFLNPLLGVEDIGRVPRFSFKKHHINIPAYLRFNILYSFLHTFYCSYLQCTWNTLCNWQRAQIFHLETVWWFHFFFFFPPNSRCSTL